MALKDLLVHVDNSQTSASRVDAAIKLASQHGAHLTGLYVIPNIVLPAYAEAQIPVEVIEIQEAEAQAQAEKAQAAFKQAVGSADCSADWDWLCLKGYADRHIISRAHYTDLVVLGQAEKSGIMSAGTELVNQVILGAARPVLFIPYIGVREPIGKQVLVAWNASKEAVRAVNDAMPILQAADNVQVLAVNAKSGEGDIPSADISQHLARHGVNAEAAQTLADDIDVGDALLSRASDLGIDLIVMGAYGHTRLRETILGGVTRDLLAHMTVPVLMSH